MLKSSAWIKQEVEANRLIDPFIPRSVRQGVISYGLGPYGYDIRLHHTYKSPRVHNGPLDPHHIGEEHYETRSAEAITIPPGSYILGRSLEYFRMPARVLGLVFGKSTYARCGVLVNVTPLEPEWEGYITISIANVSGRPVVVHPGQGIAQVIFLESDGPPLFSYKDLKGKYDGQAHITISKIR